MTKLYYLRYHLRRRKQNSENDNFGSLLAFLSWLAYLQAMRPRVSSEVSVLRSLIFGVALVLVVVFVPIFPSDEAIEVLKHWPVFP